jgi:hypothetical protein
VFDVVTKYNDGIFGGGRRLSQRRGKKTSVGSGPNQPAIMAKGAQHPDDACIAIGSDAD